MSAVKTYCFGRYLVDVPNGAILEGDSNEYIGTPIKSEKSSRDIFEKEILDQKIKLTDAKQKREIKLVSEFFANDGDKKLFVGERDLFGSVGYSIYTYKRTVNGFVFKTNGDTFGDKYIKSTTDKYALYLNQVRYRKSNEIPNDPGFCFENGFVANDGKSPKNELSSLYFRLKNNKDVSIFIESRVTFKKEPSLLDRMKNSPIIAGIAGQITTLHEGARSINGLNGEESMTELPSDDKMGPAYFLIWERDGIVSDPLNPDLALTIRGGDGAGGAVTVKSTMDKKEIRALYEQVVKSIRVRPTI